MATQTLAAADPILKDLYIGPIIEQINQKTYLLDQIERSSDTVDFTGRRAVIPLHKQRNFGTRSITDGGTLPSAGVQQYLDAIVPIRTHTVGIEITDQALQASKSSEGAFLNLLQGESTGAAIDLKKLLNRQAFGLGNGVLAKVKESKATAKIIVENELEMQYLQVGQIVDVVSESTGLVEAKGVEATEIVERVPASSEIVVSKAAAKSEALSGFAIYLSGSRNNESDGLRNITEESRVLHSVNSAAAGNQFWKGNAIKVGTSISARAVAGESKFEQMADAIGAQGNGDVEVFLTTRTVRRKLADTYSSQKRWVDNRAVDVHGGYSAIMVNEVPVVADDDCPKTFAFGFNRSALKWFEMGKPGWLEVEGGSVLHLKVAAAGQFAAIWQAFMRWYAALASPAPNRTGRLEFCEDELIGAQLN